MGALAIADERVVGLLGEAPEVEELGSGFRSAEGPIWIAESEHLLFSDISADARRRWSLGSGVELVAQPTARANGMTRDREGRLVVCEHVTSSLVRMDASGTGEGREVIASHYGGRELNSPNDVVVASDGAIVFTDQLGGRTAQWGLEREPELDFMAVFRVPPGGGEPEKLGEFESPNGLCFSPDESLLYVNESAVGRITRVRVRAGPAPRRRRRVRRGRRAENGNVDGMKCDAPGERLGHRARRASGSSISPHITSACSSSRTGRSTSTGAARRGARSSSPPRRSSFASRRRRAAGASPS